MRINYGSKRFALVIKRGVLSSKQTVLFQHGAAQPSQATGSRGLLDRSPQPSPSQGWQPGRCPCDVHAGWDLGEQGEQQDLGGGHKIMES